MLAKIGLGLVALIVILLVAAGTRPDTFRVERRATIAAPAEVVYGRLADFRRWTDWLPYEKVDPAMRRSYAGEAAAVGSSYHYAGNAKAGAGRMTLVEAVPNRRLAIRAEFLEPMKATNEIVFTLEPADGGVAVTWVMHGRQPFIGKLFSLVVDMDRMVGGDFERGLAELKRLSEEEARSAVPVASAATP